MERRIIITGDITADWNLARVLRGSGEGLSWNDQDITRLCLQPGSAAMLGELVKEHFIDREGEYQIYSLCLPEDLNSPEDKRISHSYVMWQAVPDPIKTGNQIWRVESFLGLDRFVVGNKEFEYPDLPEEADIVVIDDAGLQFRSMQKLWPKAIVEGNPDWIIVKSSDPLVPDQPNGLWDCLMERHADRTILICSISDIRKCPVRVSKGLSWEKTAQDLCWEFSYNPYLESLTHCAYVIVSVGLEGAFMLKRERDSYSAYLMYDPRKLEGDWSFQEKGYMLGYNVCLSAALCKCIAESPDLNQPNIAKGIRMGINSMRQLFKIGYGSVFTKQGASVSTPRFPAKSLASKAPEKADDFCWIKIPKPVQMSQNIDMPTVPQIKGWRILDDICYRKDLEYQLMGNRVIYRYQRHQDILRFATETVVYGIEQALSEVPTLTYAGLTTADRSEIEDFRQIAASIGSYCAHPFGRPLCLAVFGAPGSGKSFGIKQVAKSVAPGKIQTIVFNLTQFSQMKDLTDALHQVRDIGLSGKTPLVFWDEFDTQTCGWLKAFLAPMQDGEFQDGQITYHIGKAIFVFAGGTSSSFEKFGESLDKNDPNGKFQMLKGPDFLSRLHSFLNVKGPNKTDIGDDLHVIRRAILLRSLLKRHASHLFKGNKLSIDPDLLRALLRIGNYKHGARSIEALITLCLSQKDNSLYKSSIPQLAQMDIHVEGNEFMSLTEAGRLRNRINNKIIECMAAGLHQVYCEGADEWKTEASQKRFDDLDEDLKEENRRHVQDILEKLDLIGFCVQRLDGQKQSDPMNPDEVEFLAKMEHIRWMKSRANLGWVYAPKRDDAKKHHPCLVTWEKLSQEDFAKLDVEFASAICNADLPEIEREKDRVLIRAIPRIVGMAGFVTKRV